ncbi:MAG TPA: magnesium transporter [Candidatus Nanoarchaeia archaeon]|nr:magnesium transporter [Candidatus Nanoarchaeia archaeon]
MKLDKNFKEILSSQAISIIGGLVAGTFLAVRINELILIPGLLIILPGFLEMRGNISGTLSARISSGLFLGVIKPRHIKTRVVKGNLIASFFLAIFVSLVLGILAFAFNYFFLETVTLKIILLPVIAGALANLIEVPLALMFTFILFRRGHDPNNIIGPVLTSSGDIISIVSLLVTLVIL